MSPSGARTGEAAQYRPQGPRLDTSRPKALALELAPTPQGRWDWQEPD